MAKMRIISVQLPQGLINALDVLVKRGVYPNRSEAIREAIRELIKKELYTTEAEEKELPEYVVE
ncbi:ribbon-helix-helix domain-containing protein [Thermococcus aggregans]|uniref:Ribbon-helix-helix domain-containing protein n=1 Tax=Thermococcus aggregans TaxID=110163 RepID=A0A9E7MYZ7_THEAG|nr:ribbon-helix-helix domain-containing protein [Thermococcus aggregans]USS41362.1 ribbon-helix-helix domain-containing protein [Thermococcus aggregans]